MTRALVTGAAGFLGGHLVDALRAQGDTVRALVRPTSDLSHLASLPDVERAVGDVTQPPSLAAALAGVDVVYHSAARVLDYGSRADFVAANVTGTQALLAAARRAGVRRFVFVSSPSVVSEDRDQIDIDERYPYPRRFLNLYSETKALAEQQVLAADASDFVTCSIRPRGIWGPRDKHGFLPKIVAKLRAGKMPDLSGGQKVWAQLTYCQNAAHACLLAARSQRVGGKAYFVSDAERTDVWAFADVLSALFGVGGLGRRVNPALARRLADIVELAWKLPALGHRRSPPLSRYALSLMTRSATYDTSAAARDFGYRPIVTQADGLGRLKAWVDHIGGLDPFTRWVAA